MRVRTYFSTVTAAAAVFDANGTTNTAATFATATTQQVSVVGHRSFGDVVVFKVVTEWRAWHSKTEKLYTDFNKLHNK
jgi:hypothetical protein